jgi:phosphoribosylaminoimidazolecarboxamide formyltransferase/IMP cyclohydrolase
MAGRIKTTKSSEKKYALLSVFDKTGIVELARVIVDAGYKIISTGGTSKALTDAKIPVVPISEITKNPESFDGRMKTISFQIESGILFDRSNKSHIKQATDLKTPAIDIVVCNLYPFEETVNKKNVSQDEIIENIDVGGPTMIRAAAKNFKHVLVVTDPNDYKEFTLLLHRNRVDEQTKKHLAAKAFAHLSFYDSQIAHYLSDELFPNELTISGRKLIDLRYGENPHQKSAVYITPNSHSPFEKLTQHWGRGLSLTNITDINAGIESVRLFDTPAAVVIKHNNPCGIALGKTADESLKRAIAADPESAFGGVVVLNKEMDIKTAKIISMFKDETKGNMDIIAVPYIKEDALEYLKMLRKTMGIYTFGSIPEQKQSNINFKWIDGGFVLQTADTFDKKMFDSWTFPTKKKPTKKQLEQMKLAWLFIGRIRSNAIIVVDKNLPMTRGIGTGQTSRVRSTKIALEQAGDYAKGAILASDSFFPFDDSVKLAAKKGIACIVQQGGSINDKASIDAANKLGLAMVFTGRRAFWH